MLLVRCFNHSTSVRSIYSAEDRAASVGHIQGACASSSRSSESDFLPSAFHPSAFRDELNSKLRLRPAYASHDRPIAGAKSAGSSGSLISEDSPLCTPKSYTSLPPSGKRTSTVPTTPASDSVGSSVQSVSPSMTGLQHKLAVSRQRNRRPPSKLNTNVTPNSYSVQDDSTGGLDTGCADFFTSPWTIQSEGQSSFTSSFHLDFITEEENEPLATAQVPANTTPPVSHSKSILKRTTRCDPANSLDKPEDCAISKRRSHPNAQSDSENVKLARPDSSSSNSFNSSSLERRVAVIQSPASLSDEPRPVPRYKQLVPNDMETEETLLEPARRLSRPRSMFVSTPLCHPAVKMHAPSSGASPPITLRKVPVVEDASSSSPEVERARMEPPCSTHDTDEDSPCLRSVADRASIFGATLHTPKPILSLFSSSSFFLSVVLLAVVSRPAPRYKQLVPNDLETEETLLEPARRLSRPRSMFVSTPLCHPAVKMHAPSSGASPPITLRKVPVVEDASSSSPEVERARMEPPCSTHDTDEDSPCLRSVADRASIFGATLHTPKPVARTSDSEPVLRHSSIDQFSRSLSSLFSRNFISRQLSRLQRPHKTEHPGFLTLLKTLNKHAECSGSHYDRRPRLTLSPFHPACSWYHVATQLYLCLVIIL
ncbi:hypothetical protein AHF37_06278 [Paragonimus kellicotti]|nr:hypothetical protein AHF37_06278 [Paragonimus kellicotti]